MNARLAKVLGLILTLALVLSGCNLIEVDADMQADEVRRLACGLGRNVRLRAQDDADWGCFVEAWQDNGK